MDMLNKEQDLLGSRYVTRTDILEAFDLVARGEVFPLVADVRPLEEVRPCMRVSKGEKSLAERRCVSHSRSNDGAARAAASSHCRRRLLELVPEDDPAQSWFRARISQPDYLATKSSPSDYGGLRSDDRPVRSGWPPGPDRSFRNGRIILIRANTRVG